LELNYGLTPNWLAINYDHWRGFENRVLRRTSGPQNGEVTGRWKNVVMRNFIICRYGSSNQNRSGTRVIREMRAEF
jgi:hypothetical protein